MGPAHDPIGEFERLFARARRRETADATAANLATADAAGVPSSRMVLLKGVDRRGFVFYTNYGSRKAAQLAENPRAALCFYWPVLEKQVRAEGAVERLDAAESDSYFAERPRASQIGAWASRQSEPLSSRARLLARAAEIEARFAGGAVPRPEFWGGFLLRPERIEIWHGRPFRLHDRYLYRRDDDGGWSRERLYP